MKRPHLPVLRVHSTDDRQDGEDDGYTPELLEIPFTPGDSVREILNPTGHRVRAACMGSGVCGLCRVQVEEGAEEPREIETLYIERENLDQGERLSCQVYPTDDLTVRVLAPAPRTEWKGIPAELDFDREKAGDLAPEHVEPDDFRSTDFAGLGKREPLGLAIDIGTTFVSISVHALRSGERLTSRYGANPQGDFGSDILTRLLSAADSDEVRDELRRKLVSGIGTALAELSIQEGIRLKRIFRVVVVANTAILSLFAGRNSKQLLDPRYWSQAIDCSPDPDTSWAADWGINPEAKIRVVQPVAGFIGSDLLVGILAARIFQRRPGTLLIDVGTNTELALWDGESIWTTSAAGGPAFEGSGISCGIPAEPGAIHRVDIEDAALRCELIPGARPRGICGSGLVDLIACLTELGELTDRGTFAGELLPDGFDVLRDGGVRLKKGDVDVIQKAKAAIATGIQVLGSLARPGVEITEILVAGTFGRYLNVWSAQRIGMLPQIPAGGIITCGNTALAGCTRLLLSHSSDDELTQIRELIKMVNLAELPDFDERYLMNLFLRPDSDNVDDF